MPKEDIQAEFEQAAFKRNSLCNEGTTSGYKYSFSLIHQHTPAGPSKSPQIITNYSLYDAGVMEIPKAKILKRERISFSIQSAGVWRALCLAKLSIYGTFWWTCGVK